MITTNCSSESPVTVTAAMYLTQEDQSLLEKLENPEYRKQIDAIAKDMHINWAVTTRDDEYFNLEVSRAFDHTITVRDRNDMKIACDEFAKKVSMLTLPAFGEVHCINHEPANEEAEVLAKELEFVKGIKEDLNDSRGAVIAPIGIPLGIAYALNGCNIIGHDCLARMIDAYLKEYDHE